METLQRYLPSEHENLVNETKILEIISYAERNVDDRTKWVRLGVSGSNVVTRADRHFYADYGYVCGLKVGVRTFDVVIDAESRDSVSEYLEKVQRELSTFQRLYHFLSRVLPVSVCLQGVLPQTKQRVDIIQEYVDAVTELLEIRAP